MLHTEAGSISITLGPLTSQISGLLLDEDNISTEQIA